MSAVLSNHERPSEHPMTNFLYVRLWNLAKDRCGDSSCILQCVTGRWSALWQTGKLPYILQRHLYQTRNNIKTCV